MHKGDEGEVPSSQLQSAFVGLASFARHTPSKRWPWCSKACSGLILHRPQGQRKGELQIWCQRHPPALCSHTRAPPCLTRSYRPAGDSGFWFHVPSLFFFFQRLFLLPCSSYSSCPSSSFLPLPSKASRGFKV